MATVAHPVAIQPATTIPIAKTHRGPFMLSSCVPARSRMHWNGLLGYSPMEGPLYWIVLCRAGFVIQETDWVVPLSLCTSPRRVFLHASRGPGEDREYGEATEEKSHCHQQAGVDR
ncbi:hypothetical protein COMA2_170008 [Candidatus Nitrospira nitrificans]|uniref:Uncharacterized protein n=1 Tax=Candidatus Nitrospira nitrificans TaxID=1742973 RepID=A0A0S4LEW8_9BACT|nr:hypothetical protein COMA2_170008 [Candidatus Nitrospira nitrificans]